jgi:hypothetical protein
MMFKRTVLLAAILMATSTADAASNQIRIQVRIMQGDPLGSVEAKSVKLLAAPVVQTLEKREAWIITGSEEVIANETVLMGHKVCVVSEVLADGRIRVQVKLEHRRKLDAANNAHDLELTQRIYTRTVAEGETLRLPFGPLNANATWVELNVRRALP